MRYFKDVSSVFSAEYSNGRVEYVTHMEGGSTWTNDFDATTLIFNYLTGHYEEITEEEFKEYQMLQLLKAVKS